MPAYNPTLIQDVTEFLAYIEPSLWAVLSKFSPTEYLSTTNVQQWIISEMIEVQYGFEVVNHHRHLHPYPQIKAKLARRMAREGKFDLDKIFNYYIKGPSVYVDNPFVQVDLMHNTDLYIQYYQHGAQSAFTP